jgi:hypothetical protein
LQPTPFLWCLFNENAKKCAVPLAIALYWRDAIHNVTLLRKDRYLQNDDEKNRLSWSDVREHSVDLWTVTKNFLRP